MTLKLKELRIKIHPELHYRFRRYCVINRILATKQVVALITKFLDIQEKNTEIMDKLKK